MLNVSFSPFGVYYPLELAMVLKMLLVVPCLVGELAAVLKVDRGYHNTLSVLAALHCDWLPFFLKATSTVQPKQKHRETGYLGE